MSLMEGKGVSGIVDGLSTVRLLSHLNTQPRVDLFQMYAPTLLRSWCAIFAF